MANQIAEFFARIFLKNEISPELDKIIDELLHLNKVIESSKHPEMLVQEKQRAEELTKAFTNAGGKAEDLAQILTYKGSEGVRKFSDEVETLNTNSYNNFRAIGQMDRVTREFASGGLTTGLNGLTMFGNSLTRLAVQEGGFKNAISGLAGAFTGPSGLVLGLSAVVGLFELYEKNVKKSTDLNEAFIKSLNDINKKLYEIAGGSQAKLATGSVLAELITDSSKDIETRKAALNELKKVFQDSKELDKLDINSKEANNKQLLMYAINRAAIQDFDINAQKNYEEQLKTAYTERKRLEDQATKDLAAPKKDIFVQNTSGQAYIKTVAQQNESINQQLKSDLAKKDALINSLRKQNAEYIIESSKFGRTGDKKETKTQKDNALDEYIKAIKTDRLLAEDKLKAAMSKQDTSIIFGGTPEEVAAAERKRIAGIETLLKPIIERMSSAEGFGGMLMKNASTLAPQIKADDAEQKRKSNEAIQSLKEQEQAYKSFAKTLSMDVTNALKSAYDAMQHGENPLKVLGDAFAQMAEQIALAIIQASIFEAILNAFPELKAVFAAIGMIGGGIPITKNATGGITNGPSFGLIGEAGPEAIMPLSKLGNVMSNSFSAGAMNGNGAGGGGQFVLRGQDLLVALSRTQKASNLKGQSISLA